MHTRTVLAVPVLAGGLVLTPAVMQQANAAHGFGGGGFGGGGHFTGGMGGAHFGGPHFAAGGERLGGPMGSPRLAGSLWHGGPGWDCERGALHGVHWHGHCRDSFRL